jgi:replication factor C subunit 1
MSLSLVDRFKPKKICDIIGNKKKINYIIDWLKNWKSQKMKSLLIYGNPGMGKTSSIDVIVKSMGYDIIDTNASDKRSANSIEYLIPMVKSKPMFSKGQRILIMDEVDGMSSGDRGGVVKLKELIEESRIPIICIANDLSGRKLTPIKSLSKKIEFLPVDPPILVDRIHRLISQTSDIKNISKKRVEKIVMSSRGDIRNILNTIQIRLRKSDKDEMQDIDTADAVKYLVNDKNLSMDQKRNLFFMDCGLIPYYIHHMYPSYIKDIKDLEEVSDNLSLCDNFNNYIQYQQKWEFINYIEKFTTDACSRGDQYRGFIQFPQCLSKLSKTNKYKRILQKYKLDQDSLHVIYLKFLKKLVDETVTEEELIQYNYDKDDMYDLLEHFYGKKVPTKMKRKITSIYKKKDIKISGMMKKGKKKKKIEVK